MRIAYTANPGGNVEVRIINADGSSPLNLSQSPDINLGPQFSPDDKKILCESYDGQKFKLQLVNPDGTGHVLLSDQLISLASAPSWSPDSEMVAFISKGSTDDVSIVHANGTGLKNLTKGIGPNARPVWTPDGKRVLCQSSHDGNAELYWVNINAYVGGLKNITNNPGTDEFVQFVKMP